MLPPLMPPLTRGRKQRAIRESPLQPVGNGLDRSANLPTCRGGGTRKARDGGANYSKIYGRAWKPAPTTGRRDADPYARNGMRLPHNPQFVILRDSEGSHIQKKSYLQKLLRRTAQNDKGGGIFKSRRLYCLFTYEKKEPRCVCIGDFGK